MKSISPNFPGYSNLANTIRSHTIVCVISAVAAAIFFSLAALFWMFRRNQSREVAEPIERDIRPIQEPALEESASLPKTPFPTQIPDHIQGVDSVKGWLLDQAKAFVDKLEKSHYERDVFDEELRTLALAEAKSGDIQEALKTAEKISGFHKALVFLDMALACWERKSSKTTINETFSAEDLDSAKPANEKCQISLICADTIKEILNWLDAESLARSSQVSKVLHSHVQGRTYQARIFYPLVVKAKACLANMEPPLKKCLLSRITFAQVKMGYSDEARKTLEEQTAQPKERVNTLRDIATHEAKMGDKEAAGATFEEAKAAAAQIAEPKKRANAKRGIAADQAKMGYKEAAGKTFEEAKAAANGIQDSDLRKQTLKKIGMEELADDRMETEYLFRSFFKENAEQEVEIADVHIKAWTMKQLERMRMKTWDAAWAKATLDEIGVDLKEWGLKQIAFVQGKMGDIAGALETAKEIVDDGMKTEVLEEIWRCFAEKGDIEGVLRTTNEFRHEAHRLLVARYLRKKNIQGAKDILKWIARSTYAPYLIISQTDIAVEVAKSGHIEEALKIANEIETDEGRIKALLQIATNLNT